MLPTMTTQGVAARRGGRPAQGLDRAGRVLGLLGALSLGAAVLALVMGVGLQREVANSVWGASDEPPSAEPTTVQLVPGESVMLWAVDWRGGVGCSVIDPQGAELERHARPDVSTTRDGRTAHLVGSVQAVVGGDHRLSCAGRPVMVTSDLGSVPPLRVWRPLAAGFGAVGVVLLALSMVLVFVAARRTSRRAEAARYVG